MEGRAYDRARNRVLSQLAQNHPDEYQDLMLDEVKRVRSELTGKGAA